MLVSLRPQVRPLFPISTRLNPPLPSIHISNLASHLSYFRVSHASMLIAILRTVVGTADELTGQAVYAFVTLKP